jgi:hypothetical protein
MAACWEPTCCKIRIAMEDFVCTPQPSKLIMHASIETKGKLCSINNVKIYRILNWCFSTGSMKGGSFFCRSSKRNPSP